MFLKIAKFFPYFLLVIFAVLPLAAGLSYAIGYSFGLVGVLNNGFTFLHWQKLFTEGDIWFSFFYSAAIAIVALSISVSVALWLSLNYFKTFKKGLLSYIIYMPLAFPGIVAAFFFFQFLGKSGVLSRALFQLHIIQSLAQFPDLVNDTFGIGMVVAHVFLSCPFFTLLFVNIIKTEQIAEYQQLAATLAASQWQQRFKVAIPMMLQKALPNIILNFIFIFGAFEVPLLLGRSNPETVSVLALRKLQRFNLMDIPQGYAVAVLYTVFIFSIILILLKKRKMGHDA